MFSSRYFSDGCRHAIIQHNELPPKLCLSKHVNFESLYGTYTPSFLPFAISVSADITCLSVKRDLLISIDSFYVLPYTLVWLYRSEPAKSTIYILLVMTLSGLLGSIYSSVKAKIECDLLDDRFILCEPITLFLIPK